MAPRTVGVARFEEQFEYAAHEREAETDDTREIQASKGAERS